MRREIEKNIWQEFLRCVNNGAKDRQNAYGIGTVIDGCGAGRTESFAGY